MTKSPDDRRLDLLQGTLDMLILRTLQWKAQLVRERDRWAQLVYAIGLIMNVVPRKE